MSQKIIRSAIESRLNAWALAHSPPIPIAWQNATFTPPTQARYLRAFLLPAETQNPDIGGDIRTFIGLYQVSICVPDGTGAGAAETIAESLIAEFPYGTLITQSGIKVLIRKTPSQSPAMQEPGLYVVPVSISYRADVT